MKNHMVMVRHYCTGTYFQGKNTGKLLQAINDPLSTVFIVLAGKFILASRESSADATGHPVIIMRAGQVYEIFPGGCHIFSLVESDATK